MVVVVFLPFWYRLTWVVPEKGPLSVCSVGDKSSCSRLGPGRTVIEL